MKYLIEKPDYGRQVEVYRNLHKNCYSIRDAKTKRVIYHAKTVYLQDVEYKVSLKGQLKVLATKRKNVHAVVRGTWLPHPPRTLGKGTKNLVRYNPYKHPFFYAYPDCRNLEIVKQSKNAYMDRRFKIWSNLG